MIGAATALRISAVAVLAVLMSCVGSAAPTGKSDAPVSEAVDGARPDGSSNFTNGPGIRADSGFKPGDLVPESAVPPLPAVGSDGRGGRAEHWNRVVIPALHRSLPLTAAPVANGTVEIPDLGQIGWLTTGSRPDATVGVTTLVFHRDSSTNRSPFYDLPTLRPGDRIGIRTESGTQWFAVDSIRFVDPNRLPPKITATYGPRSIVLVTCGGGFQVGIDGYLHWARRVVVEALPVGRVREGKRGSS